MTKIFNRRDSRERRRKLRRRATKQAKALWEILRGRQVCGQKFHRETGIDHYSVDFYSPALRLVVEVDGSQHYTEEGLGSDEIRTAFFCSLGIQVIRFPNADIDHRLEDVRKQIEAVVLERLALK